MRGIKYLRTKLQAKETGVNMRYRFYEMKNIARDLKISTPPELIGFNSALGWCAKAVDSLADRIQFKAFKNDYLNMNAIFNANNPDIIFDSAVLSALISSCCFIYISTNEDGFPRLQVIDGANATGVIDPFTGLLKEGYAVLERDENDFITLEAYFKPYATEIYRGNKLVQVFEHCVPHPLLVPIINRPDARRDFGRSRISRACMSIVGSALRTIKRSEISAEFYSFPQKYVTGLPENADIEKWKASMSSLLTFTGNGDNDVKVGQFSQYSMQPHLEQLKMFASLFAGETGLTLDDIGFTTDNPSSAESIKASHENLRLIARKCQRNFGSGFLNVGYLSACLRDNFPYKRSQIYKTQATWYPVFEPDTTMLSNIGDGAIKLNQALPNFINRENLSDLTGIDPENEKDVVQV